MLELSSKNLLVVGLGKSGLSVASKASNLGANVWVYEDKSEARGERREASSLKEFRYTLSDTQYPNFDLVVTSPGIRFDHSVLRLAVQKKWPVISEIEFAYQLLEPQFVIGITGTNGKTTVVEMLSHVFKKSSEPYTVAGNIGKPLSSLDKINGTLILELSSFQLHFIDQFRANIGVLLNVEQDHLDWHCCFGQYLEDKLKLFKNQQDGDIAVVNADTYVGKQSLPEVMNQMGTSCTGTPLHLKLNSKDVPVKAKPANKKEKECPRLFTFSCKSSADYCLKDGYLTAFGKRIIAVDDIKLKGLHNTSNALAVLACANEAGISHKHIKDAISGFKGLKHRLQFVAKKRGFTFYNDSKATNPDSTRKAIESFDLPMTLIMGGRNKGNDFKFLQDYLGTQIKELVIFGEAAGEIKESAGAGHITETVEQAIDKAVEVAPPGIILFSPGCASFDLFENYAERGEAFIEAVKEL